MSNEDKSPTPLDTVMSYASQMTFKDVKEILADSTSGTPFSTDPNATGSNIYHGYFPLEDRLASPEFADKIQEAVMELAHQEARAVVSEWQALLDSGEALLEVYLVAIANRTGYQSELFFGKNVFSTLDEAVEYGKGWLGTKTIKAKDNATTPNCKGKITEFRVMVKNSDGEEVAVIDPHFSGLVPLAWKSSRMVPVGRPGQGRSMRKSR